MKTHEVEQRSDEWYALRAGKPTASEFSKLITSMGDPSKSMTGYALSLAAEKYSGKSGLDAWEGNQFSERGKDLEEQAVSWYEFNQDAKVEIVGFITDDAETMGCSPDGMVGDAGMVEIKCLKAERHIEAMLYNKKHGYCPASYVQQTQGQMMICGRQWCDLLFFHPDLPSFIIRQLPDTKLQMAMTSQLAAVLAERDRIMEILNEVRQSA